MATSKIQKAAGVKKTKAIYTGKDVSGKITTMGKTVVDSFSQQKDPALRIPMRGLNNVYFDTKERLLKLGNKYSYRHFMNVAHARKFMQTVLVASLAKRLVDANKHASIREVYYQLKHTLGSTNDNTFEGQEESDPCIEDLERMLDTLRERLNISADRKGYLYGDIVIKDGKDKIDCSKLGRGGWGIPSNVEELEIKSVKAKYALVIETAAMFERLIEEKFAEKNKAILLATQGQASRGIRRLIHKLSEEKKMPIIVFTDGDPYGYYIYSVIKMGSINLAYLSDQLGTPECKFIGMRMDDIENYKLQNVTERLKELDKKRIREELKYPWFQNKHWQDELKKMMTMGLRIEQQALANKSLEFVSEEYLPEKIKNEDWLP
ncbi:MAG: DNA topoisomerase IV subunit A [archaeon]